MKLKALLPKTTEYAAEFHKRKQTGVATMKENYTSACRLNSWQISVLGVWKSTSSSSERTLSDDYHTLFCEGSHMEHPAHTHTRCSFHKYSCRQCFELLKGKFNTMDIVFSKMWYI